MPDEWTPNVPDVKQDFNQAAKDQAQKEVPFASSGGISTKSELEKRTAMEARLRERMQREFQPPPPAPNKELQKAAAEEKFNKDRVALEENARIKEQIAKRLAEKKKEEMSREFNRSAGIER